MSQITLYNYFRSSPSYRVRIALYYKGLQFEYKAVHLLNNGGEHHSAEYKKINPQEEVPSLIHDGNVIAQSVAIIEYLDEVFPQKHLLPKPAVLRAQVRQFCENINSFMHPVCNLKIQQYLEAKHGYGPSQKEEWIQHWSQQGFEALEKILQKTSGKFCFGDEVTSADIFLIPQVFSAKIFKVDMSPYPLINKIEKNCLELEAFKMAHPMNQPDTPAEMK